LTNELKCVMLNYRLTIKKELSMLGTNRDYKTSARQIDRAIKKHIELMNQYIANGMDKNEASKKAYADVIKLKINGRK